MIYVLIALALVSVGLVVYFTYTIREDRKDLNEYFTKTSSLEKENFVLRQSLDKWAATYAELNKALTLVQRQLESEKAARHEVELQRDDLIARMDLEGHNEALAEVTNAAIERVKKLKASN